MSTRRMTADQLALEIMLSEMPQKQKEKALGKLNDRMKVILENRDECPECGSTEEKEDNGIARGRINFTLLCTGCGCQFEPRDG